MLGRKAAGRKALLGAFIFALYQTHERGGRGGGRPDEDSGPSVARQGGGTHSSGCTGPAAGGEPPGGTGGGAVGRQSCGLGSKGRPGVRQAICVGRGGGGRSCSGSCSKITRGKDTGRG